MVHINAGCHQIAHSNHPLLFDQCQSIAELHHNYQRWQSAYQAVGGIVRQGLHQLGAPSEQHKVIANQTDGAQAEAEPKLIHVDYVVYKHRAGFSVLHYL